ncbi:MAG: tetratricopeptide repeat protein, partial [Spirochaetota bacterium]
MPLNSQFASSVCTEAIALAKVKKYSKAKELFVKAINLNPYYYGGHYGYGKTCLYLGDIKNAIKHLAIAVKLDATSASGWFYLGFANFFAKHFVRANYCFKEAYRLDTSFVESLYNIGVIYEIIGDTYKSKVY